MARQAVLLDTDPGSEIDDVLALLYLARHPECELLGVTTVTGDTQRRAALAEIVLRDYGLGDVPVVAGMRETLAWGIAQPEVQHYDCMRQRPHRLNHRTDAVDFLRETIRSRPGEVTLVSIGPLTHVALLLAVDPEIPSLLKGMVTMSGSFFRGEECEWNCEADPVAAAMTFSRSLKHRVVGMDVSVPCFLNRDEARAKFSHPAFDAVRPMTERWFSEKKMVVFHDPLAATAVFRPDLMKYRTGMVICPEDEFGRTRFEWTPEGPHQVAREVDSEGFFDEFFSVVERGDAAPVG
ncbi:nucleoside hydrolase [bacterium]|nr:MAG: nucleoside hydrolase [bacterium]